MTTSNPALIVIDVQNGIDEAAHWGGNRNNPEAEENIESLIEHWRERKWPIVFVKHDSVYPASPFYPGKHGNTFKDFITPTTNENVVVKSTANAFLNTTLEILLAANNIREVVIVGFVTNNSVEATARMAGDGGRYKTYVVSDATAAFDKMGANGVSYGAELIHLISLSNLKDEYAQIVTTKEILTL